MITTCPVCKKDFVKKLKPQKFCSYECARIDRYPPRFKICIHCNKSFQYMSDQKNNVFCSRECYEKSRNKRVITICKFCNKEISDTVSRAKVRVYCSEKCKYKHLSELRSQMVGKDNPNYINGHSAYRSVARRNLPKKCSICGGTKERLDAHHLNGNQEENEIENLTILCFTCHRRVHRLAHKFNISLLDSFNIMKSLNIIPDHPFRSYFPEIEKAVQLLVHQSILEVLKSQSLDQS